MTQPDDAPDPGERKVRRVTGPSRSELWSRDTVIAPPSKLRKDSNILHQEFVPIIIPRHHSSIGIETIISFAIMVVMPVLCAIVYYGFIASSQYVTEFKFSVKEVTLPTVSSTASQTPAGGLAAFLGGGSNQVTTDNFIVADFLTSGEAVWELQKRIQVRQLYDKNTIDYLSRFKGGGLFGEFGRYWKSMVSSEYDVVSGIVSARVWAFSPEDSYLIASRLLSLSEELANRMSGRNQRDAVQFAEKEVEKAQDRLERVQADISEQRKRFGVIDPNSSLTASNSALTQTLRSNLAQLETNLLTLKSQNLSAGAPAIISITAQIKSTKQQLAEIEKEVTSPGKGGIGLSSIIGDFEKLNLKLQFAQTMVTSALGALDQARANAAGQHIYVEPYVPPRIPEASSYPNFPVAVGKVAMVSFLCWFILLLLVKSIYERFS